MDLLRQFQGDATTKEALIDFLYKSIDREALTRMYKGEDVSHIKDARDLVTKCFDDLDALYKIPTKQHEITNHSK